MYCVACPVQLFLKYIQLNPSTTATLGQKKVTIEERFKQVNRVNVWAVCQN